MRHAPIVLLLPTLLLPACADAEPSPELETSESGSTTDASDGADTEPEAEQDELPATFTYWRDAKSIIDAKCGSCHQPDDIAPFPLTTYDEVRAVAAVLPASLEAETMPPWPPAEGCQEYSHSRALDEDDKEVLLTWLDEGAPEGDPADAPPPAPGSDEPTWEPTMTVQMPESYTPVMEPDDYRCFLVPWPEDTTQYVTGYRVVPGNRALVHHVIMFNASAQTVPELEAMDAADPGPGYTCFGGTGTQASWVGSWVPGSGASVMPEGTGIRIEPGSMMVVQMHYNTQSSDPASDRTSVELSLSGEVERPAMTLPFTNFQWVTGAEPMHIPAGDPDVSYSFDLSAGNPFIRAMLADVDVDPGAPFLIHSMGVHMHQLGTAGSLSVVRDGGSEDCMLEIDRWDFGWQGGYQLREPMRVNAQDQLRLSCAWDNSAANQPTVDGEVLPPQDVQWGEGTNDEMCLGVLYVTAE